ncbi:MAG: hypothetical protein IJV33_05740 [Bacteroidaceae bacterium]|nr:hypothetical protein [Bacteroidaceae bacterium]
MKKTYIRPKMDCWDEVVSFPLCTSPIVGEGDVDLGFGGTDESGVIDPSAPMRNILDKDDKFGDLW